MTGHPCPVCRTPGVAYQHATCRGCWPLLPDRIRTRLSVTWSKRCQDRRAHTEALIELLMWAREYGDRPTGPPENRKAT